MSASGGRHARLTRHEHQLGAWSRARRLPDPRLAGVLERELLGLPALRGPSSPRGWSRRGAQLTLMIDLDGAITADGRPLPDAWIGGLADTYTLVGLGEAYGSIDLKLHPLGAYRLLGFPLSELTGQVVSLADVFGADGAAAGRAAARAARLGRPLRRARGVLLAAAGSGAADPSRGGPRLAASV